MGLSSGTATVGTIGRHSVTVTAIAASGGSRPYSHAYRCVELASSKWLRWQCNACPGDPLCVTSGSLLRFRAYRRSRTQLLCVS